jgi:hypothetical protein
VALASLCLTCSLESFLNVVFQILLFFPRVACNDSQQLLIPFVDTASPDRSEIEGKSALTNATMAMSKRTVFTTITPLPVGITREVVTEFLHNHLEMIDLNPLVKERHPIKPPPHATPEEFHCIWYSLTDKISYLPGGLATGDVSYTCAFHDLPTGLQTHCFAPLGLDIRDKWTLAGSLPGEPVEPVELGIGAPITGLYIREDVDMRCNVFMSAFVKKTLKKAHAALVERLTVKAQIATAAEINHRMSLQRPMSNWQQQAGLVGQRMSMSRRESMDLPPSLESPKFLPPLFENGSGFASPMKNDFSAFPFHSHGRSESTTPSLYSNSPYSTPIDPPSAYTESLKQLRQSGHYSIRDSQGRVSWQALKAAPTSTEQHYGAAVPNSYADFKFPFQQQPAIAELPVVNHDAQPQPYPQARRMSHDAKVPHRSVSHSNLMGGTLQRPFIAELE